MIKRFFEWIELKEKIHNKGHKPPFVNEGDVWWVNLGDNVGSEINGKGQSFSRPVIILRKLNHRFYLVVPSTTKLKSGSWYVQYFHRGVCAVACLHQIRTIDYRRLDVKMGRLDDTDYMRIKDGFLNLYT